jgi:GNAT superfamily N-acetyltransferase
MDLDRYRFTDDPTDMDRTLVHAWLSERSYWAEGRTRAVNDAAMDASLTFGVVERPSGAQMAYARVITDGVTFAWLCDVFVVEDARGAGIGVALIAGVTAALEPLNLKRTALVTADAHSLYEKFGFEPLDKPEMWMARMAQS